MPKAILRPLQVEEIVPWQEHWQQARRLAQDDHYVQASEFYDKALVGRPNAQLARWEYSQLAIRYRDFSKAELLLSRLLEQDPTRSQYRFSIAQLYTEQGRLEESERIYQELYQHAANQTENLLALEKLVSVYLAQEKRGVALPLLEKLILHFPNTIHYRKSRAQLLLELDYFEAIEAYSLLLDQNLLKPEEAVRVAGDIAKIPMSRWIRVALYEFYLSSHPQTPQVRRELGLLYYDLGQYDKALEHLLVLCDGSYLDYEMCLVVAGIYNENLNRPDKALLFYEQYSQGQDVPRALAEIENIQELLAADFSVLIENGGGGQLWIDLGAITNDPQDIFFKIAQNFRESGRPELAMETLGLIEVEHQREILELAEEFLLLKAPETALIVLQKYPKRARGAAYYRLRMKSEAQLGRAHRSYLSRLGLLESPDSPQQIDGQQLLEETFVYSSIDGLQTVLAYYPQLLERFDNRLKIALLYSQNALFAKADELLKNEGSGLSSAQQQEVAFLRAKNYRLQSLWYEAEQLYRQLLAKEKTPFRATKELMTLAFLADDHEQANVWYTLLEGKLDTVVAADMTLEMETELDLLHSRLFLHNNDTKGAQELLESRRQILVNSNQDVSGLIQAVDEALCQASLILDVNGECLGTREGGRAASFEYRYRRLSQQYLTTISDGSLLERAESALDSEDVEDAEILLTEINKRGIKTFYTNILRGRHLLLKGDYSAAAPIYGELVRAYPQEPFFAMMLALIEGKRGQYQHEYEMLTATPILSIGESIYTSKLNLQKARSLWRLGQKEDALEHYKILQGELGHQLQSVGALSEQYSKKSYWQEVATLFDNPQQPIDEIMDPGFLLSSPQASTIMAINSAYSSYRWHRLVSREYQARHAAYEKRLVMAERNYRMLLEEKGAEEVLSDLGPIYQRLGDYEQEARVYKNVQESGVNTDHLTASMDENQKQLQPHLDSFVGFSNREGRGGSIDMRKYQIGTDFGFTPDLGREFHFSYVLTHYGSGSKTQVGQLLATNAQLSLDQDLGLDFGFGLEKTNHDGDYSPLAHVVFNYRVLDHLRSYAGWRQARVDDTIAAVNDDLLGQDIQLGAIYESPKGLDLGVEYIYRFLSDNNEQERMNAWSEYTYFSDQAELGIRYDFEFFSGKNVGDRLSYWNPDDFRKQSFSLSFRYNLDQEIEKEQVLKRYYEIATRLGVEDDDNISYTTEFDIFLEMNPQFLLKGSLLYSKSDDYDESAGLLHLIYRW